MAEPVDRGLLAKLSPVGLVEGAASPLAGLRYMCRFPRLWRYAAIPILLNMIIMCCVLALLRWAIPELIGYAHAEVPSTWYRIPLLIMLDILIVALALGSTVVIWMIAGGVLCGYFYGELAREVEITLGTPRESMRDLALRYHIVDAVRDVIKLVAINVGFVVLHIVPVIGSIAATSATLCFDCYIFGNDYLDFPLALRGLRLREKRTFARQHLSHTLGLGGAVMLFSFIPILGAVVLATAATGAVLLHHRLSARDAPNTATAQQPA